VVCAGHHQGVHLGDVYTFFQTYRSSFEHATSAQFTRFQVTLAVRDGLRDGTFEPTSAKMHAVMLEACTKAVSNQVDLPGLEIVLSEVGLAALDVKIDLETKVRATEWQQMAAAPNVLYHLGSLPCAKRSKVIGASNMHQVLREMQRMRCCYPLQCSATTAIKLQAMQSSIFIFNCPVKHQHQTVSATKDEIKRACDVRVAQLARNRRLGLLTMDELWQRLSRIPHTYQGMVNNGSATLPQYEYSSHGSHTG